jgi:hypothetical protein
LFTPLPTITVELSPLRSSSPSPPCLGYHRPQPLVLLRPHLLHPEHRRALGYLTGLFFLTDEHHSDPSLELFFPPRLPPPRAHPGALPSVQRPKLDSSFSRACSTVINSMAPTAGRPNFAGEPSASGGGGFSSLVFAVWAETAERAGPCRAGTPFWSRPAWQAATRLVQQPFGCGPHPAQEAGLI